MGHECLAVCVYVQRRRSQPGNRPLFSIAEVGSGYRYHHRQRASVSTDR
jgi:hypothetical protein